MNQFSIFKRMIFFTALAVLLGGFVVLAQNDPFANLTYPIPELGNCQSKKACETYCDKAENMAVCLDFAEKYSLLPEEEITLARKMLQAGEVEGPGGCRGPVECEAYCDDINHIKECIAFAEKHGLIPEDELKEARKVMAAIDKGIKPPPCKAKSECDVYCSQPEHMQECIEFGEAAGLIPANELADAKKMLKAIKAGVKPPNCVGKKECDIYCQQPEHMEECMEFGIAAGFMPPGEVENAKKTLKALKQGIKPPNCQGEKACDVYCSQPEHMAECMEFGLAAGFIPPAEAENARKSLEAIKKGIMPPNCKGEEECDVYCQQPEHMAECMRFGIAAGFMPPEDIENAKRTLQAIEQGILPPNCRGEEECNVYCQQPEHMAECMEFGIAAGFMPPEEIENAKKTLEAIKKGVLPPNCQGEEECQVYCQQPEHMEECINFAEAMGQMTPEEAERMRLTGGKGPGGCQGEEECKAFCEDPANMETCIDFSVKVGDMTAEEAEKAKESMRLQQEGGPGGCKNSEECDTYCNQSPANQKECIEFGVKMGQFTPEQAQEMLRQIEMKEQMEMMGVPPEQMMAPSPEGAIPPTGEMAPPPAEMPPLLEKEELPSGEKIEGRVAEKIIAGIGKEKGPTLSLAEAVSNFLANILLSVFGL